MDPLLSEGITRHAAVYNYRVIPRSEDFMNSIKFTTSGICSTSACTRWMASLVVMPIRKMIR
jgi:hypothetical protein